ncbi:MAG: hypothetical protein HY594_00995 [Candidatus Omnitrophica bacterium]|nr:hypothetical protein [Candidatus Omnitrophota bacterium]
MTAITIFLSTTIGATAALSPQLLVIENKFKKALDTVEGETYTWARLWLKME